MQSDYNETQAIIKSLIERYRLPKHNIIYTLERMGKNKYKVLHSLNRVTGIAEFVACGNSYIQQND